MADVFISYSREDSEQVKKLISSLESYGINYWVDEKDIPGGTPFDECISDAILKCRVFLLVVSRSSMQRRFVTKEIQFADECGKHIIPYMLENVDLNHTVSLRIGANNRINAFEDWDAAINKLLTDVRIFTEQYAGTVDDAVQEITIDPNCSDELEDIVDPECPLCKSRNIYQNNVLSELKSIEDFYKKSILKIVIAALWCAALLVSLMILYTFTPWKENLMNVIRYIPYLGKEIISAEQPDTKIITIAFSCMATAFAFALLPGSIIEARAICTRYYAKKDRCKVTYTCNDCRTEFTEYLTIRQVNAINAAESTLKIRKIYRFLLLIVAIVPTVMMILVIGTGVFVNFCYYLAKNKDYQTAKMKAEEYLIQSLEKKLT